MNRNHEYYIDKTTGEAIRRVDRSGKKKVMSWGNRLTYRIGEATVVDLLGPDYIVDIGDSEKDYDMIMVSLEEIETVL